MDMKKNHRNLVRRCEKEGVKVTVTTDAAALADFNNLHDYTAKQHQFTRFSTRYIEREFAAFAAHEEAVLFRAYLPDGRLDSAAIIMYYGTMACYRHGASLNLLHKISHKEPCTWVCLKQYHSILFSSCVDPTVSAPSHHEALVVRAGLSDRRRHRQADLL